MRYCNHCHRITPGERCSATSALAPNDFKALPTPGIPIHGMPKPAANAARVSCRRLTLACRCGLRRGRLLSALPGLLLLTSPRCLALRSPNDVGKPSSSMFQAILAGLILAFLWYLYMHLPHFLRRLISRLFHRSTETTMDTRPPNSRIKRSSLPLRRPG